MRIVRVAARRRGAEYLEAAGAAVHAETIDDVSREVGRILGDAAARERMREACARIGTPGSAETVAAKVLESVGARTR